jgi:CheY-like chemotaxis protein
MRADKSSILIAEDDINDVFLLKSAFQAAAPHMKVNVVGDGEELVSYLESKLYSGENPIPAFVLLDLKMPRMDGFEALQWIRNQPAFRRLLVVAFSSSGESSQINRAYDLGANSYLIKPFEYKELVDLVRKLVSYWLDTNLAPTFFFPARTDSAACFAHEPVGQSHSHHRSF